MPRGGAYTDSVARLGAWLLLLSAAGTAYGQEPPPKTVEPPEEDAAFAPREYSFNPLQADKELKIGNFYFKKGSWKAAVMRFEEATRWNPTLPEAWLRLGEARERLKEAEAAREAYRKYLELAPDGKEAARLKQRIKG